MNLFVFIAITLIVLPFITTAAVVSKTVNIKEEN